MRPAVSLPGVLHHTYMLHTPFTTLPLTFIYPLDLTPLSRAVWGILSVTHSAAGRYRFIHLPRRSPSAAGRQFILSPSAAGRYRFIHLPVRWGGTVCFISSPSAAGRQFILSPSVNNYSWSWRELRVRGRGGEEDL